MVDKQKEAARQFAEEWKGKGDEKRDCQKFWIQLLQEVYGVEHHYQIIDFEVPVKVKHIGYIDGYIHGTKILIEQKSLGIDLDKAAKQSDGAMLTPYEQAKRYADNVTYSMKPRYIVTCNFAEFRIYDMEEESPEENFVSILLEDLPKDFSCMQFLADSNEELQQKDVDVSVDAGKIVGQLYDAFAKQYEDPNSAESMHSLNVLCVRLVFCLYAEKSGLFGKRNLFHDYLDSFPHNSKNKALAELFVVLDQKPKERSIYVNQDPMLSAFPYVNGGLFAEKDLYIPVFNDEIYKLLLQKAHRFDWSQISPTIFGAVFESTLNPETRRSGGMHYTSVQNIHKVINPLFMNELWIEFNKIRSIAVTKNRNSRLIEFQRKLASLRFFDPACGSGNFLTETYLSLRRLENEALRLRANDRQILMNTDDTTLIAVSLTQFFGIEINDFAVSVAKTALWIAESQMMAETESIVGKSLDFLPLKTTAKIEQDNALRLDWEKVVPRSELSYIMGNPPFVGHQWRSDEQVEDMKIAFHDLERHGKLDYVCGWYNKAADYMQGTSIQAAFVSTNSICQGESVGILWKFLFGKGVEIQFAYRTFKWSNEASDQAAVHCVIVGFSCYHIDKPKLIYEDTCSKEASHINGFLLDAPDVYIKARSEQLTPGLPDIIKGNQPTDGGHLLLTQEEKDELTSKYPESVPLIRRFLGASEFINNEARYCLWLVGIEPRVYRSIPPIVERLQKVKECRLKSSTLAVRHDADIPMLFTQIRQPDTDYLVVPKVSSERRRYIPMGFITFNVICSDLVFLIPDASLYHFGVLTSNVHMAWMRTTCGRLKSDYRYTPAIYNNFPWPEPTEEQRARIEETARVILDARALNPDSSLADLYDEVAMPPKLRTAHQRNDRAVMAAYGWTSHSPEFSSESACVSTLMKMYQRLIKSNT